MVFDVLFGLGILALLVTGMNVVMKLRAIERSLEEIHSELRQIRR